MTLPKELEDIIYQYHHNLQMVDIISELSISLRSIKIKRCDHNTSEIKKMVDDETYRYTPLKGTFDFILDRYSYTRDDYITRMEYKIRKDDYIESQGYTCITEY